MKALLEITEKLCNAFGAPGYEDDVLELIEEEMKDFQVERDAINNLYIYPHTLDEKKATVLLDCHSDEVGFMIEHIYENGTLAFLPLGGWHVGNIPAMSVVIKTERGDYVKGVVATKPPHFMTEEERARLTKLSEMCIDIGTSSKEESESLYGIEIGNPVVPDVNFSFDEKIGIMRAKAFDNRIGCTAVIALMKKIRNIAKDLDVNVIASVSSQEEVGLRGAQVAAQRWKPDFVIVFEGSPADDSFQKPDRAKGKLKGGVQLRALDASIVSNPKVLRLTKELAKKEEIDYQLIVREKGSTNAGKYHISGRAIPSVVLGIPTRYAHTSYCYAAVHDLEAAIELAYALVKNLDKEKIKTF